LTVDSFRNVWLQSAADPPGYDRPQLPALEDGNEDEDDGEETALNLRLADSGTMIENPGLENADVDAVIESEEFQNLLDGRELEAEINRHLGHGKLQEIQLELDEQDRISQSPCQSNSSVGLGREQMENVIKDEDDNLSDLDDDDEVAGAIISEDSEHFILRAQLWIEANKEYLREQRGNHPQERFSFHTNLF
jgi:hypothetical protein